MQKITLIATLSFGLETVVKWELQALGYDDLNVSNGQVEFEADLTDIPRLNLWLRSADRVLIKMGEFKATTFDDLFEQTKDLPWEQWVTKDGEFTVTGSSVKSQLGSVRACQSIVKKAVVERLKDHYKTDWFAETGPAYTIKVAMRHDMALLTVDTSGWGLNKRGYRKQSGGAPLKENLAAALVQLSFWNKDRLLIDPMCGSGTILIEAALIGKNIAPGLNRSFASEEWPQIGQRSWDNARHEAKAAILKDQELELYGYDIDPEMIAASTANANAAGVGHDIVFEQKAIKDLWIDQQYGVLISNPPYGVKMGTFQEVNQIYINLHKMFRNKDGWSVYILTADKKFPDYFKRAKPSRVRKLFSASLEVNYYQYYGERPPVD
ncbi:MAG TPA: class I SAM-dependent RNA methyltransferase [Anaerolineales bacterium]|nr:class I SAM-dependent RNA methyltransferase [Anaerolineales bacterium]